MPPPTPTMCQMTRPYISIAGKALSSSSVVPMARQILIHLGAKDLKNAENAEEMVKDFPRGNEILKLIGERQAMMKDAWLSATGHKRPGMNKGLPLDQAQAKAAELDKKIRP